jgi:phage protein D
MAGHSFYAPDFSVKIAGLTLAADVRAAVRSLTYDNNIDTADMFTLHLNNSDLRFTDSALFDVGKTVEIHMGYIGELQPMMLGEITAVNPSFPESGAPMLAITGYDKSHRMRHNSPPHKTFKYVNDSVVAAQIAAENGLIPVVDPSPTFRESIDQHGSDWALLQELADRNYFQLFVHWDKLYFRFPRPQTEMVVLAWGKNLSSFSPRLSSAGQIGIQVVRSYDYELAQTIVANLPVVALDANLENIIERLGSSFVDQLLSLGRYVVRGVKVSNHFEAAAFAKSILQQILEGLYEGSGSCIGMPALRAGELIEVRNVGKRFSGQYRLSRVTHTIDESGYRTSFEVSQRSSSLLLQSLRKKIQDEPPPNKQPPLHGVMVGIVRNNVGDPKGLGRVQVSFPDFSEINLSQWARVASFMAGGELSNSWGGYFLPDIDDEVLIAFEHGDINRPVIIGALWNGQARPPITNEGINAKKVFKTRRGMQLLFDETPGLEKLVIEDKATNSITLDAKPGVESITLKDKAGSTVKLDTTSGEIAITHRAGSTISLKADGSLSISAPKDIEINSIGGDINLTAQNVNVKVTGKMDVS